MKRRGGGAAFILGLMLPVAAACADEAWVEVRTEHFLVRSDVGEARALELADHLERLRQVVPKVTTADLQVPGEEVLRVDAYASTRGYRRATGITDSLSFYARTESGPLAVICLETAAMGWELTGLAVLRHEYTHHLLRRYSPVRYPRWYDEGLAEYLSVMELRDGEAVVGLPVPSLLVVLQNTRYWLSTRELMEARSTFLQNSGRRLQRDHTRRRNDIAYQYAQGWLVTHFMQHVPHYRDALPTYILALNRAGVDEAAAFEEAFGVDYHEFDRVIRNYWVEGALPYGTVDIADLGDLPEPQVRVLGPLEADAVAHETRARMGDLSRGEARRAERALGRLLDAGIRVQAMRELLGNLAINSHDLESARAHADALLAADPGDAAGATLRGRLLLQAAPRASMGANDIEQARQWFEVALRRDPVYAPALLGQVALDLLPGQTVHQGTFDALHTVLAENPGLERAEELEVRILARAGRVEDARAQAQTLLEWSSDREQQRRVEKLLQELDAEG